jgi:hypothetical protein
VRWSRARAVGSINERLLTGCTRGGGAVLRANLLRGAASFGKVNAEQLGGRGRTDGGDHVGEGFANAHVRISNATIVLGQRGGASCFGPLTSCEGPGVGGVERRQLALGLTDGVSYGHRSSPLSSDMRD